MISLEIEKRQLSLSPEQQGLATGANARAALRPIFEAAIAQQWTTSRLTLPLREETLQRMVVKYSEQWVFQVVSYDRCTLEKRSENDVYFRLGRVRFAAGFDAVQWS
jgi:hypothetical protein